MRFACAPETLEEAKDLFETSIMFLEQNTNCDDAHDYQLALMIIRHNFSKNLQEQDEAPF